MKPIRGLTPLLAGIVLLTSACGGGDSNRGPVASAPPDSVRQAVEQSIASLNDMRQSLAATIDTPTVDKATFKRVCKPVGQRAKTMSAKRGWVVQQLAEKYRNPAHQFDDEARRLYKQFVDSSSLEDTWIQTTRHGVKGWRYARRITVRSSCMACHGPKEKRPAFIKKGYPDDRAYDFQVGDLRGLYTVFVPAEPVDTMAAALTDEGG